MTRFIMTPSDIEQFMTFSGLTKEETGGKFTDEEIARLNRKITDAVIAEEPTDVKIIPAIKRNKRIILDQIA
ncbi:hypothetical protein [Methanoplanus endosymbiosus]|uniref:Uncharacterized protein n=1 Tax=Methanoplanus endosymbiosus TaxID=33865 RepID=A0A9E7PMW6_9EURY|nr:hypothetical protein [Methanoplanus endosymbiosus]UUX93173.1 hypothetical protein L6E24_03360 [Methanoplanus endosymbiosus]